MLKRVGAYAMGRGVALAVSVYETGLVIVQRAAVHRGDRVFRDRLAGSGQPLFPFGGGRWLVFGVQKVIPAEWATATLGLQQPQCGPTQRERTLLAPYVPVLGQSGIVG